MKELSIEEKAKRYDKALEIVKDVYTYYCDDREQLRKIEYIFPELKESEDERIRKDIITYLSTAEDKELIPYESWIAWLEKQGEHANFLSKIQVGDKVTRNEDGVLVNLSQLKRVAKPANKQGEQKPAWSEEDSPYYDDICEMLINLLHSETADVNKGAVQKDLDWLMSLRPQSTWKPSDKQIKAIKWVMDGDNPENWSVVLKNLYQDLKKLKK